jgi:hypothetical protein
MINFCVIRQNSCYQNFIVQFLSVPYEKSISLPFVAPEAICTVPVNCNNFCPAYAGIRSINGPDDSTGKCPEDVL